MALFPRKIPGALNRRHSHESIRKSRLGKLGAFAIAAPVAIYLSFTAADAAVPTIPALMGDLNDDGSVDVLDVVRIRNHFTQDDALPPTVVGFADVNQDDWVDERDLAPMVDAILGKSELMPLSGGTLRSLRFDDFDGGGIGGIWNPGICGGGTVREDGGRLVIELDGPDRCAGVELLGRFEGDFDVAVDYAILDVPDDNDFKVVLGADGHCIDGPCFATVERTVGFTGFASHHYVTNFEDSVQCYADAAGCLQLDHTTGTLRLIRRGRVWTALIGSDAANQVVIRTASLQDRPVQFRLLAFTTPNGTGGSIAFDNFRAMRATHGDAFEDGAIDPGRWTVENPSHVQEIGGELLVTLPENVPGAGVTSVAPIRGDFDARVFVRHLVVPLPNDLKISLQIAGFPASVQHATGFSHPDHAYDWLTFFDQGGGDPIENVATDATAGWLRLVRIGDSLTGYFREQGADWTEIDSATLPDLPDAVNLQLIVFVNLDTGRNPQGIAAFDNFTVRPVERPEDPAVDGRWEELEIDTQVLAVHAAVMPETGQVLYLSGSGNDPDRHAAFEFESRLFDPITGEIEGLTTAGDVFCAGHAFLPDGSLLIPGGTEAYGDGEDDFLGLRSTYSFHPDEGFRHRDDMEDGRWYPAAIALADGRVLVMSGNVEESRVPLVNLTVEVFSPASLTWDAPTPLPEEFEPALYPRLHLLRDGRVIHTSPGEKTLLVDPDAAGRPWIQLTEGGGKAVRTHYGFRDYGNSVLLPLEPPDYRQRILIVGGTNYASDPAHAGHGLATATAEILEFDATGGALQGPWRYVEPMRQPRVDAMSVLLPDGTVVTLGGAVAKEIRSAGVLTTEIFDPVTETWRRVARSGIPRVYHSVAVLLPDGRVWVAGSNPQQKIDEERMEVYLPPYLFDSTGAERPDGDRPQILSAPAEAGYGETVELELLTRGESVSRVALMRPNAATHASDMSQRHVALCLDCGAPGLDGTLSVETPPSTGLAPPGFYMLFVVDGRGVPSKAKWIRLSD